MKVFYSWQSDLPSKTNRGLIEDALQRAAKRTYEDQSVEIYPVIDRDTKGVPGAPDIAATILRKIDECSVFVADVSIVSGSSTGRPCPNPNVLIELGYALKTLGPERVILVLNKTSGRVEDLPFDLHGKRVTIYEMEASEAPGRHREFLAGVFESTFIDLFQKGLVPGYDLQELAQPDRDTALERIMRKPPIEDGRIRGWLHLFARPAFQVEDLVERAIGDSGSAFWDQLFTEAIDAGKFLSDYVPDFCGVAASPTVEGWTFYMSSRPHREPRRAEDVLDLTVHEDALTILHCGRASDHLNGRDLLLEDLVAGLTVKLLVFAGGLFKRGGYRNDVDVGVGISGIEGAVPHIIHINPRIYLERPGFPDDEYRKSRRLRVKELIDEPGKVAGTLLRPFFRGLTQGHYDPLVER